MFKKILFATILLALVIAVGGYFLRNMLVAGAIETGGDEALQVETDVGNASLELGAASLELKNYRISNPKGFSAVNFLFIDRGKLAVNAGSLLDEQVVVDSLVLEGLTLNLEQIDSRGNFSVLQKNISEMGAGASSGSDKRIRISSVYVRDLTVNAALVAFGSNRASKSMNIETLTLRDIGGSDGAAIPRIIGETVSQIVKHAVSESRGGLPEGFGVDLNSKKQNIIEKAGEGVKNLGKSLLGK